MYVLLCCVYVMSLLGRGEKGGGGKEKKKKLLLLLFVVFAYLWCHNNIIINDRKQEEGHAVEEHCGAFYLHAAWPGDTTFSARQCFCIIEARQYEPANVFVLSYNTNQLLNVFVLSARHSHVVVQYEPAPLGDARNIGR